MKICVVGAGHVGLVSGACFAELGNQVICMDNDKSRIVALKKSIMPFYEPGLKEIVSQNVKKKRLHFTTDLKAAVKKSEVILLHMQKKGAMELSVGAIIILILAITFLSLGLVFNCHAMGFGGYFP